MRILLLTENYPPRRGGMAQACDRIVANLRQAGLIIDVAFFSAGCRQNRVVEQQNGRLILLSTSESPGHDLNCLWNLLTSKLIPDSYTHLIAFGGNYPILALPVFKAWFKAMAITMLRGNEFDLGIFQPQKRMILGDAINSSEAVCVLSKDQMQKVGALYPEAIIEHIPNGIDCQQWHTEACDLEAAEKWRRAEVPGRRLVIGLIGQFKAKKGGIFFLENVLRANYAQHFHFLLIGDVEPQMQEWLNQQQANLSFSQLPFLDRFELLAKYPACDYLALPSHYDGMPNVLLEAGSLGIPVIAARAGGITEVLPAEQHALAFHPGDRSECQQALWNAVELSEQQRLKLGNNLADHIKKCYNSDQETSSYLSLFKQLKPLRSNRRITSER